MKLPLKWEFPGGKIEIGESKEACILREVKEELNLSIQVIQALTMVSHSYPDFSLCLYPFICELIAGDLNPLEHAQVHWVASTELRNYDWAAADIPILEEYLALEV